MTSVGEKLKGRHILVVEDEYFIADDLRRAFAACGAEVVGPVGTLDEAIAVLDKGERVDAAVLDINLRGKRAYPIADRLLEAQVPFIFLTGYDADVIPPQYAKVIRCEKPVAMHKVVAALC